MRTEHKITASAGVREIHVEADPEAGRVWLDVTRITNGVRQNDGIAVTLTIPELTSLVLALQDAGEEVLRRA